MAFMFFLNNLIFVHNLNRKVNTGKQTLFTLLNIDVGNPIAIHVPKNV
jgi:hypothetical protein